jgi:hypothetical protein
MFAARPRPGLPGVLPIAVDGVPLNSSSAKDEHDPDLSQRGGGEPPSHHLAAPQRSRSHLVD